MSGSQVLIIWNVCAESDEEGEKEAMREKSCERHVGIGIVHVEIRSARCRCPPLQLPSMVGLLSHARISSRDKETLLGSTPRSAASKRRAVAGSSGHLRHTTARGQK